MQAYLVRLHDSYNEVNATLNSIAYRWPVGTGPELHYECLYPVSGGTLGPTGDLPQKQIEKGHKCKEVFDWYFENVRRLLLCACPQAVCVRTISAVVQQLVTSLAVQGQGQYWADLAKIANDATQYFTSKEVYPKDGKHMLIFDIDETVLSNLDSIRGRGYLPADSSNSKDDDSLLAPALASMRDFYTAAYDYGYAVRPNVMYRCNYWCQVSQH